MLLFLLILSIIINGVAIFGIMLALRQLETYDSFFEQMQTTLKSTIEGMTKIDIRGSFQADDEVGDTFKQLKGMVDALDVFILSRSGTDEK
jgi:hypothetical protein